MKTFLHIGLQKTGTSSIQVMLESSRDYLQSAGYFFPALPISATPKSFVWNSAFRHNCVAGTYADFNSVFEKMTVDEASVFWETLSNSGLAPILSAEEFSRQKDFTPLALAMRGLEVEIVVYLRRQDKYIESLYNQRNKLLLQRADPSLIFDDFLTEADLERFVRQSGYRAILNYMDLIDRIKARFGDVRIHVRNFDRKSLIEGDVCTDFCQVIGLEPTKMTMPAGDTNQSVSNDVLREWKNRRLLDGDLAAIAYAHDVMEAMKNGTKYSGDYTILSDEYRETLLDEYMSTNDALREAYGIAL